MNMGSSAKDKPSVGCDSDVFLLEVPEDAVGPRNCCGEVGG